MTFRYRMPAPDEPLFIYEIEGDPFELIEDSPCSFVGLWNEEDFSYLFFTGPEDEYVRRLADRAGTAIKSRHEMAYRDWQQGLPKEGMKVRQLRFVGSRADVASPDDVIIEPSVVFGDGSHPTTSACLDAVIGLLETEPHLSVLDLGTGTGIIAVAAATMGSRRVVAVDRNRLAVSAARHNVDINNVSQRIQVYEGEARVYLDEPFDIVAANLPFQVLRDIVTHRSAGLHRYWIISGIDTNQAEVVGGLLGEQGYIVVRDYPSKLWTTRVFVKA